MIGGVSARCLLFLLLVSSAWCEPWRLTLEVVRGRGGAQLRRRVTYLSTGAVESFRYQLGVAGSKPETTSAKLKLEQLRLLDKSVSDPELLQQGNFGVGEMTLTLVKGGSNKSFSARAVGDFPRASGRLLRTVLKIQEDLNL